MAFNLNETRPAKGLTITHTEDSKFNTEAVIVRFITPIEPIKSQRRTAMISMLSEACAEFPNRSSLSRRLTELYGASLFSFSYKVGNSQVSGLTVSSIGDRYTIGGEKITADCAELLLTCIFEPVIKDRLFDESIFENAKRELIDKIKSSADNRHSYAIKRATEVAFEGEPSAQNLLGELDTAESITNEQLVECYNDMLKNAHISVSFCGGGSNRDAQRIVTERLTDFAKKRGFEGEELNGLTAVSPCKPEIRHFTERIEQAQSKLVMMFKTDSTDEFALKLAVLLYGGTPFSKLFTNVREKLSLCYYCQATTIEGKGTMFVDSGVGTGNEQTAVDEIMRQFTLMQQGDFTDEEIEDTKRYYISSLRSIQDYSDDQNSWFFARFAKGDLLTPQQAENAVREVTRERIMAAISSYKLDTVYMLLPEQTEGEDIDE